MSGLDDELSATIRKTNGVHLQNAQGARAIAGDALKSFQWADTSQWDAEPCPPREWAVPDRIPLRQVTLFSGEGAIGKSILELMLCVAHVTGKDWLHSLPEPGGAFYIGCEDDEAELRIRLGAITQHYGTTFDQLRAGGFYFKSLAGEDAILGAPDRSGTIKPTPLFDRLLEQAKDLKPKHIGIDTSADVFAGNEIDRTQVRQFIGLLRRLAIASNGSVVLLSHPSLTGINSGTGISGSTAWHNSVRARMYMTGPKIEAGEQLDSDLRELQFKKSNYGRVGDSVVLRWQRGLFLPEPGLSSLDKVARDQGADDAFLSLLKRFTDQGRNVSDKPSSNNYGPTVFAKEKEAKPFSLSFIRFHRPHFARGFFIWSLRFSHHSECRCRRCTNPAAAQSHRPALLAFTLSQRPGRLRRAVRGLSIIWLSAVVRRAAIQPLVPEEVAVAAAKLSLALFKFPGRAVIQLPLVRAARPLALVARRHRSTLSQARAAALAAQMVRAA